MWFVWKAHCNLIFRGEHVNVGGIANRALDHVNEYSKGSRAKIGKFILNYNHSPYSNPLLFVDASWVSSDTAGGMGFVIMNTNMELLFAGRKQLFALSSMEAEGLAMDWALKTAKDWNLHLAGVFIDCVELKKIVDLNSDSYNWRIQHSIQSIKQLLSRNGAGELAAIPHEWNSVADRIAAQGRRTPHLSLTKGWSYLYGS